MSAQALPLETKPLSQIERVVDTYVAPGKTFTDVLRSSTCWLPIILYIVMWFPLGWAAGRTVGWAAIATHDMQSSSFTRDQFESLAPAQRAVAIQRAEIGSKVSAYGRGLFGLIFMLIMTLILWGSFNFGMGAATKFGQVFAVVIYSTLPQLLIPVISAVLLLANVGTENFDLKNPAGTNLGYYLSDSPMWLRTAGQFLDVFGLWSLVLMVLGMAIVANKPKGQAAAVVVGWWVLFMALLTGLTAAFS